MIFSYKATTKERNQQSGVLDAPNVDMAIASLQRRGLIILDIKSADEETFWSKIFSIGGSVKTKEIVFLSRQISTMFEAKVSALATFRLLAAETENPRIRRVMTTVTDDLNSGVLISEALGKHPEVFSEFYVNMVKAGEESGKISEAFSYLAAYLERSNELSSKARNALIYPAFVIVSFVVVIILMLVYIIPKLSAILKETGQEIPIYTKVVLWVSDFFVNYGIILLLILMALAFFLYRYLKTASGKLNLSSFKLTTPFIKILYEKLYLSRIA